MKEKKRVVITGMGLVSCFGNDLDLFYQSLLAGKSGVSPIAAFPCGEFPTRFAAWIRDFDAEELIEKKQARRIDRSIAYTLVAGKKALAHAGFVQGALDKLEKSRAGVLIGSGMGGMTVYNDGVLTLKERGHRRLTPFFVPYILTNIGSAMLAMECGFMGPNYSISTACATSNYCIINAARHIQSGEADLMLCGGAEAPILPIGLAGFCAIKALSERNENPEEASRPWDRNRDGFVLGEGCGVLVLESLEHATRRGAAILAEYKGGGTSCDASHITEPREDGKGIALCVERALEDAGLSASDLNFVSAHATSTPAGDMAEVRALKRVLPSPSRVKMNATKSMIGHSLGAAGALEAIATALAIKTGKIHGTINLQDPEPDLEFDVPSVSESYRVEAALSNSFGFGGHNASLILSRFHA